MKNTRIYGTLAIMLVLSMVAWAVPKKSIVILYENDVHCAIDGYQTLAGLRDAIADTAYVAVTSSGDFVQGGTAGAISRGQYVADIMRTVGYDAIALGNHEFDYPVAHTASLLKFIGAPITCANLYDRRTHACVYAPYVMKKFGRTKIAFVGATTPGTFYTETGAFFLGDEQVYDLREKEFFDLMQRTVNQARKKGAKYVIVLGHLGEDPDRTGVNSHELAKRTTGIDVILDGHTHSVIAHDTVYNAAGKPVVISETGTKFAHIGKMMIRNGRMTHELIPFRTVAERNALTKAVTDSINMLMREKTQRVVCHSDVKLRILNEKGDQEVRLAETNLGDLVTDAYRIISGADISLANGGGIRTEKHAGDLTYGDIADILPYDNNLWIVEATGQRIIDLLQKNTSFIPVEDGSFPQVSGIRFTVHTATRTVSDVEVLNKETGAYEPIDPARTYSIATIDYCVTGGGFYDMLKDCKVLYRGDVLYRDIFVQFLENNLGGRISNDYLAPQGRIRIKE